MDLEKIDEMVVGYGLKDLPDNPDLALQIAAGGTEIDLDRRIDPAFDADRETVEYLNSIEAKLLAASAQQLPYPVHIHTSRWQSTLDEPPSNHPGATNLRAEGRCASRSERACVDLSLRIRERRRQSLDSLRDTRLDESREFA